LATNLLASSRLSGVLGLIHSCFVLVQRELDFSGLIISTI
jgi:hypothetical protein